MTKTLVSLLALFLWGLGPSGHLVAPFRPGQPQAGPAPGRAAGSEPLGGGATLPGAGGVSCLGGLAALGGPCAGLST